MPWRMMVAGLVAGAFVHEPQFGLLVFAVGWGVSVLRRERSTSL
jgi:hypothetical protein